VSAVVLTHACDVNVLTESWLDNDVISKNIHIDGYFPIRVDRSNRKGGGIIVYISSDYSIPEVLKYVIPHTESCILYFSSLKLLVISLYHPHWNKQSYHNEAVDSIIELVTTTLQKDHRISIVITGDFNGLRNNFQSVCYTFGLKNIVNFSTRGHNAVDLFYTNIQNFDATQHSPIGKSDHCVIKCTHVQRRLYDKVKTVKYPDFSPANRQLFENLVQHINFISFTDNINQDWSNTVQTIDFFYQLCFPVKAIKVYNNPKCPWINNNIRFLIHARDKAYRRKQLNLYKHYKQKIKLEMKSAKERYFLKLPKLQSKKEWNYLKNYIQPKPLEKNATVDANNLNIFFSSVYINDDNKILGQFHNLPSREIVVSVEEVASLLKSAKKKGGIPNINPVILQKYSQLFAPNFTHLINASLKEGIVPNIFKLNRITPIPKVKNPSLVSHFRPITSISPIMKVIERLVLRHWLEPLVLDNKQQFSDQFGFVPLFGRGCQSALTYLYTRIAQLVDQRYIVCTIMVDFVKAFDRVTSSKIVSALCNLRAPKELIRWVQSFLCERFNKVSYGGEESDFLLARSGTPQGSVISPILFSCILCSLKPFNNSSTFFIKYADDLTIVVYSKSINCLQEHCSLELKNLTSWCSRNQMEVNLQKTKCLFHCKDKFVTPPSININNQPIEFVTEAKLLGVYLSANLKWNFHVDNCITTASKRLYCLSLLRRAHCSPFIITKYYDTFVRSILLYGFPCMCNMPKYLFKKLVKFENRCAIIMNAKHPKSISEKSFSICKKLYHQIISNEEHPFHQIGLRHMDCYRLRHKKFIAPSGTTTLYMNSFIQFFFTS